MSLPTIDKEFRTLIPPLSTEERAQLEKNLASDGCRDPLVIWQEQGILIDGHNRLEICHALGIEYQRLPIEGVRHEPPVDIARMAVLTRWKRRKYRK